ncbi:MAG: helix-turn-helix domain-containing protein [Flavobacteriaceae bacterium]|nr:helix-turn-helix domain-containing protein [Flavobacteriaceae bacterium]
MTKIPILNIKQFEAPKVLKDVYCNTLDAHFKNNAQLIHQPHKHDFYLCVLFENGKGIHTIDFNSYPIAAGSVFFLKPGQTHFWKFDTPPKGYIIFHTPEFYNAHFQHKDTKNYDFYATQNPPHLILKQSESTAIAIYFKLLYHEYIQNLKHKRQKLANLIDTLYIDLAREYQNTIALPVHQSPVYLKTIDTFEATIETHYKTEKTVRFYASQLNITTKHLNRITKQTLNKTAIQLINERVILEAKRLLSYNKMPLKDIAIALGYEDYAYFSKRFKQSTTVSPLAFQKKHNFKNLLNRNISEFQP